MFCANCGAQIADGAAFCPQCGQSTGQQAAPVYETPVPEVPGQTYQATATAPVRMVGFGEAIKLFFQNYANFNGRATRAEFWWAVLLYGIGCCIPYVCYLWMLGAFVPYIAVFWRRLHDIGQPGAKFFLAFIPIYGTIFMIKTGCKESDGDNEYGPRKI